MKVVEEPFQAISFEDVSHKDFEFYEGTWQIEEVQGGCRVSYALETKRRFAAPGFLARSVFKKNVEELLAEVRAEILRRRSP